MSLKVRLSTVIFVLAIVTRGGFCKEDNYDDEDVAATRTTSTSNVTYKYGEMTLFADKVSRQPLGNVVCIVHPSNYLMPGNLTRYKLVNHTDINPCDMPGPPKPVGKEKTLLLMNIQPNCSLINYLDFAEEQNASGLLLIAGKLPTILKNETHAEKLEILAYLYSESVSKIKDLITNEPYVELDDITPDDGFEWSTVILWVLACFCVAVGALAAPYYEPQKSSNTHQQILDGESNETIVQPESALQVYFNVKVVLVMVVFISTTLMLLYFFFEYLVYFFMFVFCVASGRALFEVLVQLLNLCQINDQIPRIKGIGIHKILLTGICIALPLTWFFLRHTTYIWILEDLLGVCFCIHLIQTMKIPNLKICTVLLSLLFIYDIFFVFITPYLTPNGKSIMVEVATGAGSGERLPLLLQIPRLRIVSPCYDKGFSLLGFGDIILPGFLVGFANAYDIAKREKYRPYFITAMLGYAIGLSIAFVALYLTRTGQPALLYIVPAVLIPLFIVGAIRKQFRDIWLGIVRN